MARGAELTLGGCSGLAGAGLSTLGLGRLLLCGLTSAAARIECRVGSREMVISGLEDCAVSGGLIGFLKYTSSMWSAWPQVLPRWEP